jgi:ribulose bisphosphate carboxylase small subunit
LIKQIINQESGGQEVKHCKELEVISDMAVMGSITRGYIQIDTQNNPNKYISTQNALNSPEQYYRVLGILSEYLSKQGVVTAIEKKDQNQLSKEKLKEIDTFLQFLINGLSNLKKHELKFDFGWEKNQLILTDIEKQDDFMDELRYALHKGFNIPTNQMVITYPRSGSVLITVAFGTEDYNNITVQQLQSIFQQHAPDLNRLQSIDSSLVLDGILLNPELLDSAGNNLNQGWGYNEKRGGRPYYPPQGWKGYGLKVVHKYDKGNDDWLAYNGRVGEWCVAYHGVANGQGSKEVAYITGNIYKKEFKPSTWGKATYDDDLRHPGKKCGLGVYCSPNPAYAERYAGITQFNGERYKCVLMLRINPQKIRQSASYPEEYILEPTTNDIRPYRILLKKC